MRAAASRVRIVRARAWEVLDQHSESAGKLKVVSGFGEGGVEVHYFVDAGDFQGFLDHAFCAGDTKASPSLLHLCIACDENTHAGAVQESDGREVKNDLLVILFEEFCESPFHLLAIVSHADPPGHFQENDVRFDLFAFNGEDHGGLCLVSPAWLCMVRQ